MKIMLLKIKQGIKAKTCVVVKEFLKTSSHAFKEENDPGHAKRKCGHPQTRNMWNDIGLQETEFSQCKRGDENSTSNSSCDKIHCVHTSWCIKITRIKLIWKLLITQKHRSRGSKTTGTKSKTRLCFRMGLGVGLVFWKALYMIKWRLLVKLFQYSLAWLPSGSLAWNGYWLWQLSKRLQKPEVRESTVQSNSGLSPCKAV